MEKAIDCRWMKNLPYYEPAGCWTWNFQIGKLQIASDVTVVISSVIHFLINHICAFHIPGCHIPRCHILCSPIFSFVVPIPTFLINIRQSVQSVWNIVYDIMKYSKAFICNMWLSFKAGCLFPFWHPKFYQIFW